MAFCSGLGAVAFAGLASATASPSASWSEQVDFQHSLLAAVTVAVSTVLIDGDRVDL